MNADVEKVKTVFGVSEIRKKERSIILGSKGQGIICFMDFEGETCISLIIKSPSKELYYFPVNTSIFDTVQTLYNMLPHEPPKGAELWYEEEIKNLDKRIIVVNESGTEELPARRFRRRRKDRGGKTANGK